MNTMSIEKREREKERRVFQIHTRADLTASSHRERKIHTHSAIVVVVVVAKSISVFGAK